MFTNHYVAYNGYRIKIETTITIIILKFVIFIIIELVHFLKHSMLFFLLELINYVVYVY